jgi:hypothetical protein
MGCILPVCCFCTAVRLCEHAMKRVACIKSCDRKSCLQVQPTAMNAVWCVVVPLGALVCGPDASGAFSDIRAQPQQTGVSLHGNAALSGLLAGLMARDVRPGRCNGGRGEALTAKTATLAGGFAFGTACVLCSAAQQTWHGIGLIYAC